MSENTNEAALPTIAEITGILSYLVEPVNVVAEIRASLPIICRGSGRNSRADHSDEDYLQVHREIAEKWITEIERREALQPNLVSLIVCQQLNSRREELETEVERLRAREASILALAKRWEAGIYHHAAKIAGEDDWIMSRALDAMNHMRRELHALLNPQGDTL